MHFSEVGKMQISPKLELCRANQDQIQNQRPRLRRNTLFLVRKAVGGFKVEPNLYCNYETAMYETFSSITYCTSKKLKEEIIKVVARF